MLAEGQRPRSTSTSEEGASPEGCMTFTAMPGRALTDSTRCTDAVKPLGVPTSLVSPRGFTVSGQRVESVSARPGIAVKLIQPSGDAPSSLEEVDLGRWPSASIALRFADGSGTI